MIIYLLNDKEIAKEDISDILSQGSHKVICFDSLSSLIGKSHPRPHLIFFEIKMPKHNSLKALSAIRQRYPDSVVVAFRETQDKDGSTKIKTCFSSKEDIYSKHLDLFPCDVSDICRAISGESVCKLISEHSE